MHYLLKTQALYNPSKGTIGPALVEIRDQRIAAVYEPDHQYAKNYQDREVKNMYSEHAERNAIYNAARNSINIMGSSIAVSFHPCHECAKGIIQSGIRRVIYPAGSGIGSWAESIKEARFLFDKTGVEVIAL